MISYDLLLSAREPVNGAPGFPSSGVTFLKFATESSPLESL